MSSVHEGDRAPDFTLVGGDGKKYSLRQFRGVWIVLYFYPQDDTETCTLQACSFRDHYKELTKKGAVVIGISPDSRESHQKFSTKYQLPFLLLSDDTKKVMKQYGVWKKKTLFGRTYLGVVRTTFIIDQHGKITRIFPRVRLKSHIPQVIEAIAS